MSAIPLGADPAPDHPPHPPTPPRHPVPMRYVAFIGDLVDSRKLPNRRVVQRDLRTAVDALNETFGAALTAPLRLTAGDEIQGLTRSPAVVVDVMTGIADALFPVRVAWGMGLGEVSTELADDVALIDGPCFHLARAAVEDAGRSSRWLRVAGLSDALGSAVAGLVNLVGALRTDWTPRQAEVVRAARGRLQVEVAEALDVHASTISRTLAAAHYDVVLEGEAAARALLSTVGLDAPGGDLERSGKAP